MPASFVAPLALVTNLCPSCSGSLWVVDLDGGLSGTVGLLVPCDCVSDLYGMGGQCPCHVWVWDENGGHTGWIPVPADEFDDDAPFFRRCTEHAPAVVPLLAVAA
ncbi:hypothetical protein ACGFX4_00410 [Kitasatospora sp. NPDC048365]|uniref:hypothetical protein n=1 Tax=Kitasatospora sp. NPDC048365 TaxID=3364050 RepID=UPI0037107E8E